VALAVLSLCSGVGGLDLGVRAVLPDARVVAYCERDAFAAAVLLARMQDESLDPAPVWCGDLERLPVDELAGRVDLVTAGFPCQPVSVAGSRRGTDDERWIWPAVARVVREVRPRFVFLENVPGLLHAGPDGVAPVEHVLGDLAGCGYDARWTLLRASAAGAPHRRARFFLLAWRVSDAQRDPLRAERGQRAARSAEPRDAEPRDMGAGALDSGSAADLSLWRSPTSRDWKGESARSWQDRERGEGDATPTLADQVAQLWPTPTAGDGRAAGSRNAPGSAAHAGVSLSDAVLTGSSTGRAARAPRLSPAFVEALMGLASGWTDPCGPIAPWAGWPPGPTDSEGWERYLERGGPAPVTTEWVPDRSARLAALGNAVVWQQAAIALEEMIG
jgi:DNA (cytosine-5)-methyltransferase 1